MILGIRSPDRSDPADPAAVRDWEASRAPERGSRAHATRWVEGCSAAAARSPMHYGSVLGSRPTDLVLRLVLRAIDLDNRESANVVVFQPRPAFGSRRAATRVAKISEFVVPDDGAILVSGNA